MRDRARRVDLKYALIAAGIAILIIYGSLYPFRFHRSSSNNSIRELIGTWRIPTSRGDFLANLLLYFPFGLFLVLAFRVPPKFARIALVIAVGFALSVSLEWAQFYDEGRDPGMADIYANLTGTVLGASAGSLLFRKQRRPLTLPIARRPFVLLLLGSWLGYRLTPFAPTIDLHKYWLALKPLVMSPVLPPLDLYRHAVITLALALLLEALFGVVRSRVAILALVPALLLARVLILDTVLSPAEVVGGVVGIVVYNSFLWKSRVRLQLIAGLFAGVVVIQGLEPFRFSTTPHPFGWIPFLGFLHGSVDVNIRSLFEKVFSYGALVWLTARAGYRFPVTVGLTGGLVLCLRLGQIFLPGRSAEITDVIMLLMMATGMKLMGEDPADDLTKDHNPSWWRSGLMRLYENLTRNDPVQPCDLIFVLAGRMERKPYGLELYRAGMAPRLVLSVGRFEVSRMHQLELSGMERLIALRDATPPEERNFFVEVNSGGIGIERARLRRCSTYGEVLAFRRLWEKEKVQRVMVISTDVHLCRTAVTFASIFRHIPVQFLYCPVPARLAFLEKEAWWTRPDERRFVVKELIKLVGYRLILSTPPWATRPLMRLKD